MSTTKRERLIHDADRAANFARDPFCSPSSAAWWYKAAQRDYLLSGMTQHAQYCQLRIDQIIADDNDKDI